MKTFLFVSLLSILPFFLYGSITPPVLTSDFAENKGQVIDENSIAHPEVLFKSSNGDVTMFFKTDGIVYLFNKFEIVPNEESKKERNNANEMRARVLETKPMIFRMDLQFLNTNPQCRIIASEKSEGVSNYYLPGDLEEVLNVSHYNKITYKDIYDNIDIDYYFTDKGLKYDVIVHPGGDIRNVKFKYNGANSVTIDSQGRLVINFADGQEMKEESPIIFYENIQNNDFNIQYSIDRINNTIGFAGNRNSFDNTLIIDPSVVWSTYFYNTASSNSSWTNPEYDGSGNLFLAVQTYDSNFPTVNPGGGAYYDGVKTTMIKVAILKFNINRVLVWSTFYGGNQMTCLAGCTDYGKALALDNSGNAYLCGYTDPGTTVFPTLNLSGSFYQDQSRCFGTTSFFVKFNNSGVRQWASVFQHEQANTSSNAIRVNGITCDGTYLYFTGETYNWTPANTVPLRNPGGAHYQTTILGDQDVFVGRFAVSNCSLNWCTYLHSTTASNTAYGQGTDLHVDKDGNLFVTGRESGTNSHHYLINPGGGAYYQATKGANGDVWIAKFNSSLTCVWGTYYGGNGMDIPSTLEPDALGNFYIVGRYSASTDLPTQNPGGGALYQGTKSNAASDAFILRFSSLGVRQWATYLGANVPSAGSDENHFSGIAINTTNNNFFVSGYTKSTAMTAVNKAGSYNQASNSGGYDMFYYEFNSSSVVQWASYYGGTSNENAYNCRLGIKQAACGPLFFSPFYATTQNLSTVNPGSGAWYQSSSPYTYTDYFLEMGDLITPLNVSVSIAASANPICPGTSVTFTATPTNGGTTPSYQWYLNGSPVATGSTYTNAGLTNGNTIYCVLTSSETCTTNNPATSNTVTMVVNSSPPNDNCANAVNIAALPYNSGVMSNSCSTNDIPAGSGCSGFGANVWFTFTGTGNSMQISTDNAGTTFDTELHIYTGSCGSLTEVTCDDDGGTGTTSLINLCSTASTTYYVSVGYYSSSLVYGNYQLTIVDYPLGASTSLSASPATICSGSSSTLSGTVGTNGNNISWYTGSCGGTLVGSSTSLSVSPTVTTTYYARTIGTCGNVSATCNTVTVTVNTNSTAPTSISATSNPICSGSTTLSVVGGSLGTGASWQWYTGGCGTTSAGTGASITVTPGSSTTYYVRAEGTCNTTTCASLTITVNTSSTAPTSISATTNPTCGGSTTLSVNGGSLGAGASWQWYTGGCGTTSAGTGASITVTPGSSTTYYVRAEGTCNTTTCASLTITVNTNSTAPTSISATTNPTCGGSTTLSVNGGSLGTGASWQWYTGSCGGTSAGSGASITVSPGSSTTYYVRAEGTCNTTACASLTITVNSSSTAPTSISATTNPTCGGATTLSVNGGSLGAGASWYWYTGGCGTTAVSTGASITVSPGSSTTYYVRAEGTCNTTTCASLTITVNSSSTAPTSISATTNPTCGGSTTLSVNGGSLGTGASWQWYTGSCGGTSAGSGASITVTPGSSTTYYVRAEGTCNTTACSQLTVTVNTSSTAATSISATTNPTCGGSTTLSVNGGSLGTGASWQWYTGVCGGTSAGTGTSVTVTPSSTTTYFVRAEGTCNTTACVQLTVTVNASSVAPTSISATTNPTCGGSTTLSVNGGGLGTAASWQWYTGGCGTTSAGTGASITVTPAITTTYYVRAEGTCNNTACAQLTVTVNTNSTAPTSITASQTTVCSGTNVNLALVGGSLGTGASWYWYSGSCGGTPIGNGTGSLTVTPSSTTTYYVRAEGTCNTTTCAQVTITVNTTSTAASSISASQTTICSGTSVNLSVVGGVLGATAGWYWYSGACGTTPEGSNTTSITVSPTTTTTYFVRAEETCGNTACASVTINVNTPSVAATSAQASPTAVCSGAGVNLSLTGGTLGSGANWYWYTDNCGGTAAGTGASISVNPTINTTYFVRAEGTCNTTTCEQVSVTIKDVSVAVISVQASVNPICQNQSTTLTFTGGSLGDGAVWNWYSGSCGGALAGTGNSITVNPAITTTYYVRAEGDCNTTSCQSIQVNVNPLPNPGLDGSLTVCSSDASVNLFTSLGGTPDVGGVWVNPAGTQITQPVDPETSTQGIYLYIVSGLAPCLADTAEVDLTILPAPVLDSITLTDNTMCNVPYNGAAEFHVTGGGGSYTFSVDGGAAQPNPVFTALQAGSHTYSITGINTCAISGTFVVSSNTGFSIDSVDQTNILCHGDNNGELIIYALGGVQYSIDNGTTLGSTNTFTGLSAGSYNLVVVNGGNCQAVQTVIITEPFAMNTDSLVSSAICGATGSAQIICSGGVPPYTFEWSNGVYTANNNNLEPGTYLVTVTDQNGCFVTNSAVVGFLPGTGSASADSVIHVSCNGLSDGLLGVAMNYGVPPYTYTWQHDPLNNASIADSLAAGAYYVTINDNYGCSATFTYTISEPQQLTATHNVNNATCGPTGSISVIPSGGTSPYIGVWNTTDTTLSLTQLSAGFYSVTVVDAHMCTYTINNIEVIDGGGSGSAEISNLDSISCHGSQDGSITVSMPLGFLPITYNWMHDPSLNSATASNLAPGQYVVTLTDSYGCTAIVTATMTEPALLAGIFVAHQTLCHGTSTGNIELSVTGGTPQYSYAWSNSVIVEDLTDVPTGYYSITVTDAHGCTWHANDIYVRDAPAMIVNHDVTNVSCNGDGNGSISLTILGGNDPYQAVWSNSNTGLSITGLDAGTYYSTITDANNCVINDTATVSQPATINGTLTTISPECHNSPNGSVYVSEITGGLPPYAYEWNNSIVTDSLLTHVLPGSYTITITDSLGCEYTMTATVQNSDNICLVIPDVFTPNGDQINETFEILGIEAFMEAEMQIYNRWGDMLFKSTYYNEFWDGTWNGEPVPMGAYVFILDLKNGEKPMQGVVTIVY